MKEHPIIFSADMVKAILDGRKAQTRRVIKSVAEGASWLILNWNDRTQYLIPENKEALITKCPYGQVGDRFWVRETWCLGDDLDGQEAIYYKASKPDIGEYIWKPSIFMPRWASRITLEITEIRVQRVQEITTDDAIAEGIDKHYFWRTGFQELWDKINAKRGYEWNANPWVWAISFKPTTPDKEGE